MIRTLKAAMVAGVACVVALGAPTVMAQSGKKPSVHKLPGGASSLNETYQDWQVMCQQGSAGARCAAVQQAFNNQNHQRILSVQLMPENGRTTGIIVAPLGVALVKGVTLQSDGQKIGEPMGFTACVADGCLAPASFNEAQFNKLQNAKKATVKLTALTGQDIVLPFSTKGLSDAVARVNALMH